MTLGRAAAGRGSHMRPPQARGVCLDSPGQWRGLFASSVWTTHRAVKQGQSVGTTSQGKGRVSRDVKTGKTGAGRALAGERPVDTASLRQRPMQKQNCRTSLRMHARTGMRGELACGPPHLLRWPQRQLDRRLKGVAKAVGGGVTVGYTCH